MPVRESFSSMRSDAIKIIQCKSDGSTSKLTSRGAGLDANADIPGLCWLPTWLVGMASMGNFLTKYTNWRNSLDSAFISRHFHMYMIIAMTALFSSPTSSLSCLFGWLTIAL